MSGELLRVLLGLATYVALPVLCLLPVSYLVRVYVRRVKLDRVLREMEEVAMKLRETSPTKERRWRMFKSRYDSLYKSVRWLLWLNLLTLWVGVLAMIYLTRYVAYLLEVPPPYSPLRLSWTPFTLIGIEGADGEWYVVDLFLYLAALGIFNHIHIRISGMGVLYEV
jgi:hypothetical protein